MKMRTNFGTMSAIFPKKYRKYFFDFTKPFFDSRHYTFDNFESSTIFSRRFYDFHNS